MYIIININIGELIIYIINKDNKDNYEYKYK